MEVIGSKNITHSTSLNLGSFIGTGLVYDILEPCH